MQTWKSLITITVPVLLGLMMPAVTWAELPPDQAITYLIHETPDDPNSSIVFTVTLTLEASSYDGDSIGWDATKIKFMEFDEYGDPDRTWIEEYPNVPTEDGLWWIEHADPAEPQPSEFAEPPLLEGTAAANDPNDNDLEYSFDGETYSRGPLYDATGALNYEFTVDGKSTPLVYGEDEPVEIDDDPEPPGGQ